MKSTRLALGSLAAAFLAAAAIAGCGGGGGGYAAPGPPGGGGGVTPSPAVSPSTSPLPTATPSPGIQGTLNVTTGGTWPSFTTTAANMLNVVFSCGCTAQAGIGITNASGNYVVVSPATATPSVPNPTYTIVPTRNYVVVAQPANGAGPQAWQLVFAGSMPSHDLALADGPTAAPASSSTSDTFTAAATLFVYFNSGPNGALAFDKWNFNTVQTFTNHLVTSPNVAEKKLMNDIAVLGGTSSSLFPSAPTWNPSQPVSGLIANDIKAVNSSVDVMKPTPCPSTGCTGTPTP